MVDAELAERALFDFPELTERRHLVAHLLRNTSEAVYVRGLPGVGKTMFYQTLLEELAIEFQIVRVVPGANRNVLEMVETAKRNALVHEASKPLLLAADDTDNLPETALSVLKTLHAEGARLLFCGRGHVVPQIGGAGLRVIDLPTMNLAQTEAFIENLDPVWAANLDKNGRVDLLHETGGIPGKIISRVGSPVAEVTKPLKRPQPWVVWLGGFLLLVIVTLGLWQQDAINDLFVDDETESNLEADVEPRQVVEPKIASDVPARTAAESPDVGSAQTPTEAQATAAPARPALERSEFEEAKKKLISPASVVEVTKLPPAKPWIDSSDIIARAINAPQETGSQASDRAHVPAAAIVEQRENKGLIAETPLAEQVTRAPASVPPGAVASEPPESRVSDKQQRQPPVIASSSRAVAADGSLPGAAWISAQPDEHYTLQLMGGRNLSSLRKLIEKKGLSENTAIIKKELNGAPWYSLVYGSFADRNAATAAQSALGKKIPKDAWPRRFRAIR